MLKLFKAKMEATDEEESSRKLVRRHGQPDWKHFVKHQLGGSPWGETKVVEETKVELKTAVYKVHVHCGQCNARDIETQFTEFHGMEGDGEGRRVRRGEAQVKVSKGCRRNVEYIPPPPPSKDIFTEIKSTKEEIKIITVKVPLHCPDCAVRVKEILLEHKSIYAAKTDFGKGTCVIEGVIEEKKLTEYIYQRTRKHCIIDKVETTVRIVEETVVVKKNKEEVVEKVVEKVAEVIEEKIKEVVAPYFLPCTHPHFVDYCTCRTAVAAASAMAARRTVVVVTVMATGTATVVAVGRHTVYTLSSEGTRTRPSCIARTLLSSSVTRTPMDAP
ncbi:hypothetical protein ZWY2020_028720 [Hordeum vulgare]|nr:hypothetical protein ZWY2020_028720 [Hordeum vulgare]